MQEINAMPRVSSPSFLCVGLVSICSQSPVTDDNVGINLPRREL